MVRRICHSLLVFMPILILFSIPQSLYAQDDDPGGVSLPVLQPEDIFTGSVEVVETLPEVNYDGISNLLYYLPPDAETWEAIAVPDELVEYTDYVVTDRLPNGSFELSVAPSEMGEPCQPSYPSFEFDLATGGFTRHEPEPDKVDISPYWTIVYDVATEDIRLLNSCDFELVAAALPDDISDLIRSNVEKFGISSTQMYTPEYLVVAAPPPDDEGTTLFAIYAPADDDWSESFPFPEPGSWGITDLVFEDGLLYFLATGEAGTVYYTLDIITRTFTELFRTPYPQAVYRTQDDVFYYIDYDDTHYQFYSYDLFAQQGEVIAEIPCADVTGDCIKLSIRDGNRSTEIPNLMLMLRERERDDFDQEFVRYIVVDATESRVLYQQSFPSSNIISVTWLDQDEPGLLIDAYQDIAEAHGILVDLSSDDPAETQRIVPYQIGAVSPDQQRVIVYSIDKGTRIIGIVDLETLAYQPINSPVDSGILDVRVSWLTDTTLEVRVRSATYDFNRFYGTVSLRTWIIQV